MLVATGVATADEFTRCRVLGFSHFQGEFFARPRGEGGGSGAVASLQALGELTASEASFEELERIIGADVGLSIALLRHVNSAFFALPREIDTVREALTLLGTRAVRRWATVVALSSVPEAPDQLVALALLRGAHVRAAGPRRERGGARPAVHRRAVLGRRRAAGRADGARCSRRCRFSEEIAAALLRYEGRRGRVLGHRAALRAGPLPGRGRRRSGRARRGLPRRAAVGRRRGRWLA